MEQSINALKQKGNTRIEFASGSLGNGEQSIQADMDEMQAWTEVLRKEHDIPIFSSVDVFRNAWDKLDETHLSQKERSEKMKELFRGILHVGITDIFILLIPPGWRKAPGAVDEFETAEQIGITIHDLEQTLQTE